MRPNGLVACLLILREDGCALSENLHDDGCNFQKIYTMIDNGSACSEKIV